MKKLALSLALLAALAVSSVALAAGMPGVKFMAPKVSGTTATLSVKLTNFTIDAAAVGKLKAAGKGHLHFALDGGKFDYPKYSGANGQLAVKLGIAGKYSPSVTPSITYKNLPKGKHTAVVFLANNDHSAVGPKATVSFTVR